MRAPVVLAMVIAALVLPTSLYAQEQAAADSQDVRQIEAAAARAESAAAEARALLEGVTGGDREDSETAASSERPPASDGSASSDASAGEEAGAGKAGDERTDEIDRALEDVQSAAEEARAAAEEARAVANAARAEMKAYRNRFARTGPYLGVAGFYADEDFDAAGFDIDSSIGGSVFLGYRVHRHVAVEVRGEYLEGFDIEPDGDAEGSFRDAELDGFLVTAGPKLYPFTGVLQPFVGVGFGVMRGELEGQRADGTRFGDRATDAVIRPAAGLDYHVSENLVLNAEAAYVSPGGSLEDLDFAVFSGGLTFRF